jgi:Tfp pilus assembly protein PilO
VSAAPEVVTAVPGPGITAPPPATPSHTGPPALVRRLASRLGSEWLPRAAWTLGRTGRPGLVGIALLLAATLFLFSTHLEVVAEVQALRAELAAGRWQARPAAVEAVEDPTATLRALPARTDMPAILSRLFNEANRARLAVDTAKYEITAMKSSGVVRYRIAFPVIGSYPQVRAFIDATLATMPAVGLSDLVLERKSIASSYVEAQIRMTVYTRSAP